jgi:hypothetical protein
MRQSPYRKYPKQGQLSLAVWAADCAERVLPFFEEAYPDDDRPRTAIEACRAWVRTGVFSMSVVRGASLASHAAACDVVQNSAARFAARAAGQAVATAHVTQHAYGAAYYALKAIAACDPANAVARCAEEREWQSSRLPGHLRQEIMSRILVVQTSKGIKIKIEKGDGF